MISFVLGSFSSKDLDAPALSHTFESQLLYCTVQYSTVQYSAACSATERLFARLKGHIMTDAFFLGLNLNRSKIRPPEMPIFWV